MPDFANTSARFVNADPFMVALIVKKYEELDLNKDGMLNFREVAELLRSGDDTMTDKEIRTLFNAIDQNGTGRIDLQEFAGYVFDIQPEGTDRQQKIDAMRTKAREYEKEVQDVEVFGATLNNVIDGKYVLGANLNGRQTFDRPFPEGIIFYGWTEGRRLEGWFVAKRAPAEGRAVIRYKMFNPSLFALTPNRCTACWEDSTRKRDKRMVVERGDTEEWDLSNTEGFCRGEECYGDAEKEAAEEAEEYQAKFGDDYELDEGNPDEQGDWDTEWLDQAGEAMQDVDDEELAYENDGDDREDEADDPADDWTDPDFPPQDSSVGGKEFGQNGWTRLTEVHDQACIMKVVGPSDVLDGEDYEGNRWFLSACACIAEYPAWIQSMFSLSKLTKLPGDHKYSVRLYHPGKKSFVHVEVDDFVPTRNGSPLFACVGVEGEIWCPLIEKAFAKVCKSYKSAGWGSIAYGLLYLCGGGGAETWQRKPRGAWGRSFTKWKGQANDSIDRCRAEGVVSDGVDIGQATMWLVLSQYMELCYPVCATACKAKAKKAGLCADRGYSIIATQEVPTNGGILRLVRIRNSWGETGGSWKGRWSDESEAWVDCPAAFNRCKFKRTDGNAFWMSWNDFVKYFEVIDCVKKSMPIQGCRNLKLDEYKAGIAKFDC